MCVYLLLILRENLFSGKLHSAYYFCCALACSSSAEGSEKIPDGLWRQKILLPRDRHSHFYRQKRVFNFFFPVANTDSH